MHISIAIVSTQLNGFYYCYLTLIIPFTANHLFANSEMVILLFNTIHLFAHNQMVPSIAMLYQYFNFGTQLRSLSIAI